MSVQVTPAAASRALLAPIGAGFRFLFDLLESTSRGARCAREAERLFAMSDEELARIGLKRDEIIPHAFGPYLHI